MMFYAAIYCFEKSEGGNWIPRFYLQYQQSLVVVAFLCICLFELFCC